MGATMKDVAGLVGAVEACVPNGTRGQASAIGAGIAV